MNINNVSLMLDAMNKAVPALFECGMIAVTGGLQNWSDTHLPPILLENQNWVHILLHAHTHACWDDMPPADAKANHDAIAHGGRIFSAFSFLETRIYVITEDERSVTTLLLSDEY